MRKSPQLFPDEAAARGVSAMARQTGWRRIMVGGKAESEDTAPAAAPDPHAGFARIERGVEMSGKLVTERPLRIEGEFRGEIESASMVIVTEGGSVEAPIRARTVEIHGAVVGNVTATRELVIHATGKLHGDVEAPSVVIERGAIFSGRTQMYRPQPSRQADTLTLPEPATT
jgi:cytoskeletal protein CcmA (bactofilin family)